MPRQTNDGGVGPRALAAPVDCESKFGLPELWQEEHQRRLVEEEWRHRKGEREEAAVRAEEEEMMRRREQQALSNAREKRKSNFVDPDNMVEEKVELLFENVVVVPLPKKKNNKIFCFEWINTCIY